MTTRNSKLRKVTNRAFCVLIAAFFVLTAFLPGVSGLLYKAAAETLPIVSISESATSDGGFVKLKISLNQPSAVPVTVHYHTEAAAAIPGVDYVSQTGSVTINGTMSTEISVATKSTSQYYTRLNGVSYYRYFYVVLDSVDNNVAVIGEKYRAQCNLRGNLTLGLSKSGSLVYVTDYATSYSEYFDESFDNYTTRTHSDLFKDKTKTWYSQYVSTGLAGAYAATNVRWLDHEWPYSSGTNVHFMIGNLYHQKYGNCSMYNTYGLLLGVYCETTGSDNAHRLRPGAVRAIVKNGENPKSVDSDWVNAYDWRYSSNYVTMYSNSVLTGDDEENYYFYVEPYNGEIGVHATAYCGCRYRDLHCMYTVYLRLIDTKQPTVDRTYLDDSILANEGKMRLILQMSEPVYTAKTRSSIEVTLRKQDGTDGRVVTAYYAGGNYTDTLYYDFELPRGTTVYGYRISNARGTGIGDFAYRVNGKGADGSNNELLVSRAESVSVMLGTPVAYAAPNVSVSTQSSNACHIQYDLTVNTGVPGCTLYYQWTKGEDDGPKTKEEYEFSEELTGTEKLLAFGDGNTEDTDWYLHVMAINKYGLSDSDTFGPYRIDRTPPQIREVTMTENTIYAKRITINASDLPDVHAAGINRIEVLIDGTSYVLYENGEVVDSAHLSVSNSNPDLFYFKSVIRSDEIDHETPEGRAQLDERILDIMDKEGVVRRTFTYAFRFTDASVGVGGGNSVTITLGRLTYDTRKNVVTTLSVDSATKLQENGNPLLVGLGVPVYDLGTSPSATAHIAVPDGIGAGALYLQITDNTKPEGYREIEGDTLADLLPGYYEITPIIRGTDADGTFVFVSDTHCFYVTAGKKDATVNCVAAGGNLVLVNKVFEISGISFTYLPADGALPQHFSYGAVINPVTKKAEGGSATPAFSSEAAARAYLTFMEYQDMQLIKIKADVAGFLNSNKGSTSHVKADGETQFAQEGQYWIRYKRATWTQSSDAYAWAYYYYGEEDVGNWINVNMLSVNLRNAVNSVTRYIISNFGETVYLVGEENTSTMTRAPYLLASQMHVEKEWADTNLSGVAFDPAIPYEGDAALYDNRVTVSGAELPLATNLKLTIGDNTHLYYRYAGEDAFTELNNIKDGTVLSNAITGTTGIYTIREVDDNGMCEFAVYFDRTAPTVTVNISGEWKTLSAVSDTYSGKSFTIGTMSEEVDEYAYIAIYTYGSGRLLNVYYAADLATESVTPDIGNYTIEVGDRSGNRYAFSILLSTSELNAEAAETASGTGILVRCRNREPDEIFRYEVRCNNENLEVDKDKLTGNGETFRTAGIYYIYIRDIYDNEKTFTLTFNYRVPDVTWSYEQADGSFASYNPDRIVSMVITDDPLVTGRRNISTAAVLSFKMSDDLGTPDFKFTGLNKENFTVSKNGLTVTTSMLCNWSVDIWYQEHPENVITYVCFVDGSGPSIEGTYVGTEYGRREYDELEQLAEYAEDGDELLPDTVNFARGVGTIRTLPSGAAVCGSCVTLYITDSAGVASVAVKRNGEPVPDAALINGTLLLNDYGEYEVTAVDKLGNSRTFTFTNTQDPIADTMLGGTEVPNLTGKAYGNSTAGLVIYRDCALDILVTAGNVKGFYHCSVSDNQIFRGYFYCTLSGAAKEISEVWDTDPLFTETAQDFEYGRFYPIFGTEGSEKFVLSAAVTAEHRLIVQVECPDGTVSAQMRAMTSDGMEPTYLDVELSTHISDVPVFSGTEQLATNHDGAVIYAAGKLSVGTVGDPYVVRVDVAYSENSEFVDFVAIYNDGDLSPARFNSDAEGFYCVRVTNRYGNVTEYVISRADMFNVVIRAEYRDNESNTYNANDTGAEVYIRANRRITVFAYCDDVAFTVNGTAWESVTEDGVTRVSFDATGVYAVTMKDRAGNTRVVTVEIGSDETFRAEDSWLIGYNEAALRRAEGYTNRMLSLLLDTSKVSKVTLRFADGETVLYDVLGENRVQESGIFPNCVGNLGDGVYEVCFRNAYGDLSVVTVHYRATPTLTVERATPFSIYYETLGTDEVAANGVFSGNSIRFSTDAEVYQFFINGEKIALAEPKVLQFSSNSGNGSFEYTVSYVDEYGFSYEFVACLLRQDILVSTDTMRLCEVEGKTSTANNVSITFADGLYAFVILPDGTEQPYVSGTVFRADGLYSFTVVDVAGNIRTFSVIHDSVAEFTVTASGAELPVTNGSAVNAPSATFRSVIGDTSYLKSVFLNGTRQANYDSAVFTATGYWELIVEDEVGNTAYFSFYLLNHALKEFSFTAPYGYTISEVWLADPQGVPRMTTHGGDSIHLVENGDYAVILLSLIDSNALNFTVTVDNTPPTVKLKGCEEGEETRYEVTLADVSVGDIITVYRNGALETVMQVESTADVPTFTQGGDYVVEIRNLAGATQTLTFTKKHMANTAASVLIVITCVALAIIFFVALIYRNRSKTDD